MKFESAEWFLLSPLIAAAAWFWPHLRLLEPRRAGCAVLLLLLLAAPLIRRAEDGIDLWLLVDRSSSAATALARDLAETETILNRTKGLSDRLRIVDYATSPVPRESLGVTINPAETRTALAIRHVTAQLAPERLARILVLTDGFATEPLAGVSETLLKRHIPLDYRLLVPPAATDFRVDSMEMPPRVRADESFVIEARLIGSRDGAVEYEVTRDGQRIGSGSTELRAGEARVRLIERTRLPGAHRYAVRVISAQDAHPENDSAEMWTEVLAGPRVVLLSAFDHDPVADILRTHVIKVEQITELSRLHAGVLSGARLVIFNNVPAHLVSTEFQRALDFYVREQGGGVLMCGGRFSFGSGGWANSPVDALLPVSMELRKEHRKLRVAMAIILDRSGSMAASVSADGQTKSKMDLADEGTAQAISLLGDDDLVSVFAVDSAPHVVARLTPVGPARQRLMDDVLRIQSTGGGIFVYEGLKAGWDELKRADTGQRHLILFSDAADSEQPGEYKTLIAEMTAQGATISVIGLGTEKDSDAELLKDIARRGNGRIFFNANAAELPALFAQETVAVARSAFLEEKTKLAATAGWMQIAANQLPWLSEVDGYNLSYLKPEATAAATGSDEYAAPLVAFWQRGLGRAAAISFPVAGDFSAQTRAWPAYGEFVTTLVRWLSGDDAPAGLALTTRLSGTHLDLDLFYGPEWVSRIADAPPRISLAGGEEQPARTLQWEKMAPGHFRASRSLSPGERLRGAAQIGNIALPFGPIATASNAEWQFRREALLELRTLSRQSGGRERLDLATSWESPPIERFTDIQPWLITALVFMLLLDALLTRLDWWSSDAWARRVKNGANRADPPALRD